MNKKELYRYKQAKEQQHRNIYAVFHFGCSIDDLAQAYGVPHLVIENIIRKQMNRKRIKL